MAFSDQVAGITSLSIGTTPTNDELSQFLVNGTKDVINRIISIRPDEIIKFTASSTDTDDSGVTIQGQIISVVREQDSASILRPCNPMDAQNRYEATVSTSLHYRSAYNPGFYELNGKVFTVPAAAGSNNNSIVTHVYYATNTEHNGTSIDNFPSEYEYLVVLYASAQSMLAYIGDIDTQLPSDVSLAVVPTTPSLSASSISFTETTTYTPPVITIPGFPSLTWTFASPPNSPVLSSSTVSALGTAPAYTKAVMTADIAGIDTQVTGDDPEMADVIRGKVGMQINEYQADIQNNLNDFNEANVAYQADLQKKVQDAQLSSSDDSQKIQLYSAEVQNYSAQVAKVVQSNQSQITEWQTESALLLQKYTAELSNSLNQYNQTQVEYQGELQIAIQEAQLISADDAQKLQKYATEVQTYSAEVQSVLADYSAKIQKLNTKYQWAQGRYIALRQEYNDAFGLLAPPKQRGQ
tara:strand:- start:2147 stop:3547 length:1401 start_codon:yes stop_codon:yes gene_type:complete